MSIEVRYTCPFGHTCQKVAEDGVVERCNWYVYLEGKHPQSADNHLDGWGCAIAWSPIVQIGTHQTNRQTTKAVQQLRNVVADEDQRLSRGVGLALETWRAERALQHDDRGTAWPPRRPSSANPGPNRGGIRAR